MTNDEGVSKPAAPTCLVSENECDQDVYEHGQSIGYFDIPKETANAICAGINSITGARVDWHYFAGRVHMKALIASPAAPAQSGERVSHLSKWRDVIASYPSPDAGLVAPQPSPTAVALDDERTAALPPLPDPVRTFADHSDRAYSRQQMLDYARAASPQPVALPEFHICGECDRQFKTGDSANPAQTERTLTDDACDAARYRWLRRQHWNEADMFVVAGSKSQIRLGADCPSLVRLDDAIDAALTVAHPASGADHD